MTMLLRKILYLLSPRGREKIDIYLRQGKKKKLREIISEAKVFLNRSPSNLLLGRLTSFFDQNEKQFVKEVNILKSLDIIVPVYNNAPSLILLLSDLEHAEPFAKFIFINDASPDQQINVLLNDFKRQFLDRVLIISNEENLGFSASVNIGFFKSKSDYIVLLNSDTRVPKLFASRMSEIFLIDKKTASVTPLTNSGTICSIPEIGDGFRLSDTNEFQFFDESARRGNWLKPKEWPKIPTAVGFCMMLSRTALEAVGGFDANRFQHGYGEENDWSLRAIKKGWNHRICPGVFVYHHHGGSYGPRREILIKEHSKILANEYPRYPFEVQKFLNSDPLRYIRIGIFLNGLKLNSKIKSKLFFDHQLGGGAIKFLNKEISDASNLNLAFIITKFELDFIVFKIVYGSNTTLYFRATQKEILELFNLHKIDSIVINTLALVSDNSNEALLVFIAKLLANFSGESEFRLHDFHSLCPSINLIDSTGAYCNLPVISKCLKCLPSNSFALSKDIQEIQTWRHYWSAIFINCGSIRAFSNESATLFLKIYPELNNRLYVEPHINGLKNQYQSIVIPQKQRKSFKIVTVGNLNYAKGSYVVRDLARSIVRKGIEAEIVHIGNIDLSINEKIPIRILGSYQNVDELIEIIKLESPNILFFPSIWPETYSFVFDELAMFDLPILSFNLGAPVERYTSDVRVKFIAESFGENLLEELLIHGISQEKSEMQRD